MLTRRTDLAVEAREIWHEYYKRELTQLEGVSADEYSREGLPVHRVDILDESGEKELSKPCGRYITIDVPGLSRPQAEDFPRAVKAIAAELRELPAVKALKEDEPVIVVGLGNRHITPDAIGPITVDNTMITRHLVERAPEYFGAFRKVSGLAPGVLGITGIESVDVIAGVCEKVSPRLIIAVDALASRKVSRLLATVQISDTGIVPGSGIGNARVAINEATLGVPVVAIGVPTVVDASTLAIDLLESSGLPAPSPEELSADGGALIVTPRDIDRKVEDMARVIGYAINAAMHEISIEDIAAYLS
ncbi:GPR endopeptidase [Oscillospiraceae bacterium OttesenSCG-928-G22]|nr:GPR endopeptidase [Oscillospiraceae bacterium OttesenSCG-928-G22]